MTWMQTAKGRAFDLLEPHARDVDFEEIAFALARLARFAGHAGFRLRDGEAAHLDVYTVALHSALGAEWLLSRQDPEAAFAFLLHDAHEAYLGGIASPVVAALAEHAPLVRLALRDLKFKIDGAIWRAANRVPPSPRVLKIVHDLDIAMLRLERDQLMAPPPLPWVESVERAEPPEIDLSRALHFGDVEGRWLNLFNALRRF